MWRRQYVGYNNTPTSGYNAIYWWKCIVAFWSFWNANNLRAIKWRVHKSKARANTPKSTEESVMCTKFLFLLPLINFFVPITTLLSLIWVPVVLILTGIKSNKTKTLHCLKLPHAIEENRFKLWLVYPIKI